MGTIRLLSTIAIYSLISVQGAHASTDADSACRLPFDVMVDPKTRDNFPVDSAVNPSRDLPDYARQRYIVADLNTADENGLCRGVEEVISPAEELSEFNDLKQIAALTGQQLLKLNKENIDEIASKNPQAAELLQNKRMDINEELVDLENFNKQVAKYATKPISKERVHNGYCVGQTVNYCELVNGQPKLVFRFITSTSKSAPPSRSYYAPINFINTRHWSSDRRYSSGDKVRDHKMGGGDNIALPFANGGHPIEMPNFMNFLPMSGYPGETQNGIHEIAGGLDSGGTFGAPVSLGCMRLNDYQAKLSRWWTPKNARMYIHFDSHRYLPKGDEKTGKAKGFKPPRTS